MSKDAGPGVLDGEMSVGCAVLLAVGMLLVFALGLGIGVSLR